MLQLALKKEKGINLNLDKLKGFYCCTRIVLNFPNQHSFNDTETFQLRDSSAITQNPWIKVIFLMALKFMVHYSHE